MPTVTLKPGHVRPVWAGHPWVYSQAIASIAGGATAGCEVDVVDPTGKFLGRGLYSPTSAIPVRIYGRDERQHLTADFFAQRIRAAVQRRKRLDLPSGNTNAYRVIHAAGDDLPGLVVDRFGDTLVVQLGTIGLKLRERQLLDALEDAVRPTAILDRTPAAIASTEGFEPDSGVLRGDGDLRELVFVERGLRYRIPLELGQKTGFYVDQRPLRERLESLSRGRRVLDVFAYVGSFAMTAARGGAGEVLAIESSALAHEAAIDCAQLNDLRDKIEFQHDDARRALAAAAKGERFDIVVCDPPKLAPTRGAKKRALQKMRRLASAACRASKVGGLIVVCSCSGSVRIEDLTRSVALGARDVGLVTYILERHFQGADHPVPAAFPEGLYLSTVIAEVHS